jgi:cytosol alanyl aminopeptidase
VARESPSKLRGMRTFLTAFTSLAIACGPAKPSVTQPAPPATSASAEPSGPAAGKPGDALVPPQPTLRLPKNFVPTGYAARLVLDPAKPGFTGAIEITGKVSERSSVIWLHGRKLKVTTAAAHGASEVALEVTPRGEDLLEVRAKTPLDAGEWKLEMQYAGDYDMVNTAGVFKQVVADQPYVFTQFEALYARRAFPCVDEPDNKVPWKLTLDVPKQLVAVANTPVTNEAPVDGNLRRIEFGVTKPLPSYLIAFAVGPFDVIDAGKTTRGTPVRMIALAKRGAEAAWAAKTTPKILEYLEDWFGMPYPYEKLDMISIPITVGFGAMENAGAVTFTETLMLLDPQRASKERQHRWVVVAAHELAHQWFGDLVTMAWWDDIWLNEGFANWMEHKISARMDPAWHDDQAALRTRNDALASDALVSARKIRQPIATVDDIHNVFDGITYDKGASILSMFEAYLKPDVFQRGVRDYLAAHSYGNATSADFAAAISKAAGTSVEAAFASFLEQGGAPELTVIAACEKGGKPSLQLAQRRYVPPGSPQPPATTPYQVPVCVSYDANGKKVQTCTLLGAETGSLALETKTCPRWVMPNADGRGYYRASYTPAQLTALRDEGWAKLSWGERRAIFFDVQAGAVSGKVPLQLALSFVPKLLAGNDRFTVVPAVDLPTELDRFVPAELRGKYEAWLRTTFGVGAAKAGLVAKDGESFDVEQTREGLVHAVAWLGREPTLVASAVKLADKWRDLPQSVRKLVLELALDAKPELFEKLLKEAPAEPDRARRQELYTALASVRDPKRQAAALGLILDPKVDIRESLFILHNAATDENLAVSQKYFRDHQAEILARIPKDEVSNPGAVMSFLFGRTCRAEQRDAMADYITKTFGKMPGGARISAQAIEDMDQCIARRKALDPEIRAWLGGVKTPAPAKPATPAK